MRFVVVACFQSELCCHFKLLRGLGLDHMGKESFALHRKEELVMFHSLIADKMDSFSFERHDIRRRIDSSTEAPTHQPFPSKL